ncbi:hypothetical protein BDW74DRAFT_176723 [Aspergillus multicolor]|uniref:uncharacterized protein n=1 Tax=Aspergillus multicolor TaxID=41759 RepID=UPI003CCDC9E3
MSRHDLHSQGDARSHQLLLFHGSQLKCLPRGSRELQSPHPNTNLPAGITNEQLLARFSNGVFGGRIFTPERWIAPIMQRCIDEDVIAATGRDSSIPPPLWDLDALSQTTLPPLGTTLFGLLTLFDTSACTDAHRTAVFPASANVPRPTFAFAEYAGRTRSRGLAASHRFEVTREREREQEHVGEEEVEFAVITFSHVRSNPATGGKSLPTWFVWFHVLYSGLLFAEGIREVLRG